MFDTCCVEQHLQLGCREMVSYMGNIWVAGDRGVCVIQNRELIYKLKHDMDTTYSNMIINKECLWILYSNRFESILYKSTNGNNLQIAFRKSIAANIYPGNNCIWMCDNWRLFQVFNDNKVITFVDDRYIHIIAMIPYQDYLLCCFSDGSLYSTGTISTERESNTKILGIIKKEVFISDKCSNVKMLIVGGSLYIKLINEIVICNVHNREIKYRISIGKYAKIISSGTELFVVEADGVSRIRDRKIQRYINAYPRALCYHNGSMFIISSIALYRVLTWSTDFHNNRIIYASLDPIKKKLIITITKCLDRVIGSKYLRNYIISILSKN